MYVLVKQCLYRDDTVRVQKSVKITDIFSGKWKSQGILYSKSLFEIILGDHN